MMLHRKGYKSIAVQSRREEMLIFKSIDTNQYWTGAIILCCLPFVLQCKPNCGPGTVEQNGQCVPAQSSATPVVPAVKQAAVPSEKSSLGKNSRPDDELSTLILRGFFNTRAQRARASLTINKLKIIRWGLEIPHWHQGLPQDTKLRKWPVQIDTDVFAQQLKPETAYAKVGRGRSPVYKYVSTKHWKGKMDCTIQEKMANPRYSKEITYDASCRGYFEWLNFPFHDVNNLIVTKELMKGHAPASAQNPYHKGKSSNQCGRGKYEAYICMTSEARLSEYGNASRDFCKRDVQGCPSGQVCCEDMHYGGSHGIEVE